MLRIIVLMDKRRPQAKKAHKLGAENINVTKYKLELQKHLGKLNAS